MQTCSSKSPPNSEPEDSGPKPGKKAVWTTEDETLLLNILIEQKAGMTDGQMFKLQVFHAAALKLNASITKGGDKTEASCRAKWQKVCHLFCMLL
jgi:hypothetical protein